ncbi:MAG: beta-eliminating lyase-related protein [Actinomycetota bacterium]|nr:beta-eliminating lyase-related protein [Actinomycetota bacterium]
MSSPDEMPAAPERSFASDNAAGAHPAVIEALVAANEGHALAYGDDRWTAEAQARFRDLFGPASEAFLVWNGTGANVMALATMLHPAECVVCTEWAHIAVDEAGAPERVVGAKLLGLPAPEAKLVPEQLASLAHLQGEQHHAQPAVVSITQSTELGTLYSADEVAALCETAHRMGMLVHLDGARIANATAALGGTVQAVRSFTVDAGVDVVSFGGTKAGLLGGEAVVYLDPALAARAKYTRKMVTQLPSKMRFIAAQFNALLHDDLWISLARQSNAMASRLYDATREIPGVAFDVPPVVNSLFVVLPNAAIQPLRDWSFFWDWDVSRHQVRWMTAWDTTDLDVQRFAAGLRHVLGGNFEGPLDGASSGG